MKTKPITLILTIIICGCSKIDTPSNANQTTHDTAIPIQDSVGTKADTQIGNEVLIEDGGTNLVKIETNSTDLAVVDEVMHFLQSVKLELRTNKTENGSYTAITSGQKYKQVDGNSESYRYFDFKYDKDRKTLSWKSIYSSQSYTSSYLSRKTFGNYTDYQDNYTMSLEGFNGAINIKREVLNGDNITIINIPQSGECVSIVRRGDLDNDKTIPKRVIGWWEDQKLESNKQAGKSTHSSVDFKLPPEIAKRLKPALEDLFKAHGSKLSKY
jgi:hypothetical protein